jgi:hypothetical protein
MEPALALAVHPVTEPVLVRSEGADHPFETLLNVQPDLQASRSQEPASPCCRLLLVGLPEQPQARQPLSSEHCRS